MRSCRATGCRARSVSATSTSNLAVALLGNALARRVGEDYETLVVDRICKPLGLTHTHITLDEDDRAHLAAPHGRKGKRVANWDLPAFAGAGGLRSNADDMMTFVADCLAPPDERFATLLATTLEPRRSIGKNAEVALGWHIRKRKGGEDTIWHNGATGGYCAYIGFRNADKTGVVVLVNRANGGPGPKPGAVGNQVLDLLAK